jgi:hypothetical protein
MRRYTVAVTIALLAASATVASASNRSRDRDRDREEERHRHDEGDDDHGGRGRGGDRVRALGAPDPAYVKECGACHVAYPPALLPAAAWTSILSGLDRHFGQNAEVDAATRARLEQWIVSRAAPASGASGPLRITEQAWFRDEHDEVPRDAASRPSIKSMANCSACHAGAEAWDFDGDRVRIPGR